MPLYRRGSWNPSPAPRAVVNPCTWHDRLKPDADWLTAPFACEMPRLKTVRDYLQCIWAMVSNYYQLLSFVSMG